MCQQLCVRYVILNWFGISATKCYRGSCNPRSLVLYYARLDHYTMRHLTTQLHHTY